MANRIKRENPEIIPTTGGVGHASNAMSRANSNREALQSKKHPRTKSGLGTSVKTEHIDFINLSAEDLVKMKEEIRKNGRAEKKRHVLIFIAIVAVVATFLAILFW